MTRQPNAGSFTRERLIRHGMCYTPTWCAWKDMKRRCLNSRTPNFPRYGGRGIKVCESWLKFENFISDMGIRPDGMSLERKDNNGNYEPGNCIWADRFAQMRNTRRNRYVEYRGERLTVSEWSRRFGVPREFIRDRMDSGQDAESIFARLTQ